MTDVSRILGQLRRVKATGKDRWIACCPAHEDRLPSMTVRLLPDGRVLMHCFAGCEVDSILGAIGLTFADLFPDKLDHNAPRIHAPFNATEALRCLTQESAIIAIHAGRLASGQTASAEDTARLCVAAGRIASVLEAVHA